MDTKEPYFVPMTLKDVENYIHKTIRNNPDIDGTELIVGAKFVEEDDTDIPQGSILLTLKKSDLDTDGDELYGTMLMMPIYSRNLQ